MNVFPRWRARFTLGIQWTHEGAWPWMIVQLYAIGDGLSSERKTKKENQQRRASERRRERRGASAEGLQGTPGFGYGQQLMSGGWSGVNAPRERHPACLVTRFGYLSCRTTSQCSRNPLRPPRRLVYSLSLLRSRHQPSPRAGTTLGWVKLLSGCRTEDLLYVEDLA